MDKRVTIAVIAFWIKRPFHRRLHVGIRGRLFSGLAGVASLTLLSSIVAFFSYSYISRSLQRIENEGIPVMNHALVLARQAAEYVTLASSLRAASDQASLTTVAGQLQAKHREMAETLKALGDDLIDKRTVENLKGVIYDLELSTDHLAVIIEHRLMTAAEREHLLVTAMAAHRSLAEKLAPLLDDASFNLMIGLEALGEQRPKLRAVRSRVKVTSREASAHQWLADLRTESYITLGIFTEVSSTASSELLRPLRDRFTASSYRARKAAKGLGDSKQAEDVRAALESLLAIGREGYGIFDARNTELTLIANSGQLISANQLLAARLTLDTQQSVQFATETSAMAIVASRAAIQQSQLVLVCLVAISLTIAIVFAWIYVGKGLLWRLANLNGAMLQLADGNLAVAIPHEGHDEISRMAEAVEVFKRNMTRARELEAERELDRVEDLKRREASFRLLYENNPVPMWVYDRATLRLLSVNGAAIAHYGYAREQFLSMTVLDIHAPQIRDSVEQFLNAAQESQHERDGWEHLKSDGSKFEVAVYARPLNYEGFSAAMVAVIDVTQRRRAEARVNHMARHDALTNLPNRVLFREKMEDALVRVSRGENLAVLCLDLDHFKSVNDTLGHSIGDALLRAVSGRLMQCLRDTDTVSRFGGDEFAIIQEPIEQPQDASALARRIIEAIAAPYDIDGHQMVIGTSIGIAIAPGDGIKSDELLKNADLALYRAKSDGRGTHRFFEPDMDARMQARRTLELDLRKALVAGEFELFYQPLVNLESGAITTCEALLRWHHPERGLVSPAEFIPLAEELGLIVPLGEWVVRQACEQATSWPVHIKVAVNLSPVQFRSRNLVQAITLALASSGLSPSRLELEITESVLLQDNEATLASLHQLKSLGIRISMDDFGTGYSSLSYLRSFPFDKIKIDQSFIRDLASREDCLAIVRAVTGLGANLGMTTTAEGVETGEQVAKLRAEGCTEVQGYLFSPPIPAREVDPLLRDLSRLVAA